MKRSLMAVLGLAACGVSTPESGRVMGRSSSELDRGEQSCQIAVPNEGFFDLSAEDKPPEANGPFSGYHQRRFQITSQERFDYAPSGPDWSIVLHGQSADRQIVLGHLFKKPWVLGEVSGQGLVLENALTQTRCVGDSEGHPAVIEEKIYRHADGTLWLDSTVGVVQPGGVVLKTQDLTPEYSVSWSDVGCPDQKDGSDVSMGTPVELTLTTRDGLTLRGRAGDRQTLSLSGDRYVWTIYSASSHGSLCGTASWTLYREGALLRKE